VDWIATNLSARSFIVKFLLSIGANVNIADHSGRTPLCWAVSHALLTWKQEEVRLATTKTLLSAWGAGLDEADNNGRTPLSWAISALGYSSEGLIVTFLLSKRAQVDRPDNNGRTPLRWAATKNNPRAIETLLKYGASLTSKDKNGKTPYDWAVELERLECFHKEGEEIQALLHVPE